MCNKRQIQALEKINRNFIPGGTDDWEPIMGDNLAPRLIPEEEDLPPLDMNDLYDTNDSLVTSQRLSRIAHQLIENGFRGS